MAELESATLGSSPVLAQPPRTIEATNFSSVSRGVVGGLGWRARVLRTMIRMVAEARGSYMGVAR